MALKIVLASLIRQEAGVLHEFLQSLFELDIDEDVEREYLFIDDNVEREAQRLLYRTAYQHENIQIIQPTQLPLAQAVHKQITPLGEKKRVALLKDRVMQYVRDEQADYLFLSAPHFVLPADLLTTLLTGKRDVMSPLFWVRQKGENQPLAQAWLCNQQLLHQYDKQLQEPGVYDAEVVNGSFLFSSRALGSQLSFFHSEGAWGLGEDALMCQHARRLGLTIAVDSRAPVLHLQVQDDLERIKPFKEKAHSPGFKRNVTISLCMIVRDEEDVLERCLQSVQGIPDEWIIVDTGSCDRTQEIAARYTDRLYQFDWVDNFAAARNFAFQQATQEYILWLDADDVLPEEERDKFLQLKKSLDRRTDSVSMLYRSTPTTVVRRNRLLRRERGFYWEGRVHEYVRVKGHCIHSDIMVVHQKEKEVGTRNLRIYRKQLQEEGELPQRDWFYFGNELQAHHEYEEAIEAFQTYLHTRGPEEDSIAACLRVAECFAKLHEWEQALHYVVMTFRYDVPRAEACCYIGELVREMGEQEQSIFWFTCATQVPIPTNPYANREESLWTWYPHLQLGNEYVRCEKWREALHHYKRVDEIYPDHPQLQRNKAAVEAKLAILSQS
ncbi:glycosyltransferase [Mechercharimyces sp. CAU 1602]|uniref:tetratricopeptide repeat-containing glycosyltransferase family 2 protein n=1 Tax=Mechercharimyces sp. CAU 1602 TaxID=2973933 RepID=UPI0021622377|nr:glycosyltransferase [Mechercharimyces sp. CAU 1602]MCS1352212.1 glycosyltransferase [Mechercharimyces sp. CAU 1602]